MTTDSLIQILTDVARPAKEISPNALVVVLDAALHAVKSLVKTEPPIELIKKLYKRYQNPGMALPEPTEYERGFDQALDLAIGILTSTERESGSLKYAGMHMALRRLVLLKEHKDKHGKDVYYEEEQPFAWKQASGTVRNRRKTRMRKRSQTLIGLASALRELPQAYMVKTLKESKFGYLGRMLIVAPKDLLPLVYINGQWCEFENAKRCSDA